MTMINPALVGGGNSSAIGSLAYDGGQVLMYNGSAWVYVTPDDNNYSVEDRYDELLSDMFIVKPNVKLFREENSTYIAIYTSYIQQAKSMGIHLYSHTQWLEYYNRPCYRNEEANRQFTLLKETVVALKVCPKAEFVKLQELYEKVLLVGKLHE